MLSRRVLMCLALGTLPLSAQAHDLYSNLTDEAGASCCNNHDCHAAPYRFIAGGLQMFVDRRWIKVPMDKIQYRSLSGDTGETGGGHWCGYASIPYQVELPYPTDLGDLYMTRCAILPPQSGSAQDEP